MKRTEAARISLEGPALDSRSPRLRVFCTDIGAHSSEPATAHKGASRGTDARIIRRSRSRSARLDKGLLRPVSLVAAAVCFVVLWMSGQNAEQRGIQALPPAERGAFYERTLDNVRDICGPSGASALRQYCGEQAILLGSLPECGDECRTLIRPFLAHPAR